MENVTGEDAAWKQVLNYNIIARYNAVEIQALVTTKHCRCKHSVVHSLVVQAYISTKHWNPNTYYYKTFVIQAHIITKQFICTTEQYSVKETK